ncbi:deoxyribodipyrimidine photo-lyase [Actibacterium sp. 188UL27-1]|uniref:cryptochrome/photolyase family protein n=1 Tax=Actibacterium sp. 188UL27-1 TaxID=2786961 RepID=UPI00195D6DE3|nr:deoxyribodipyrimidine photo-lyase [Actibacterium sp. 188UL27-1]MBM7067877.1 deoxyribodipyrimidine photo-lyase [Actibacterium sp. 188UL27-1]
MGETSPIIVWFRRDLRLGDHPALTAACVSGRPVIPVFIRDHLVDGLGIAPKWRLGEALAVFADSLAQVDSRLIFRSGDALEVLQSLVAETGAGAVYWSHGYLPDEKVRDDAVKSALSDAGLEAKRFGGHLLFEPWTVETKTGGFFKVYTPMWKSVKDREVANPKSPPSHVTAPQGWPVSDALSDWALAAGMDRGAAIVRAYGQIGEAAALARLDNFIASKVADYDTTRDVPAEDGTSRLSENLSLGEIGPRTCWHAGYRALQDGKPGAETFLKELVWREFAYHLAFHTPRILSDNWREEWQAFPWSTDEDAADVIAWKQGRTGIPFVDAAMREMYVTGKMHNRGRMIVASYLTKHLMVDWKIGMRWFEDCLTDWDPASNAMGWQWSAGSGPDATPYFRVFNPVTQLDKFDKTRAYVDAWIAEGKSNPSETAMSYFDAIPRSWGLSPEDAYPAPIVSPEDGRKRALEAYQNRDF